MGEYLRATGDGSILGATAIFSDVSELHAMRDQMRHRDRLATIGELEMLDYLARAAAALERAPVVIGPALDGGYVLIGARVYDNGTAGEGAAFVFHGSSAGLLGNER